MSGLIDKLENAGRKIIINENYKCNIIFKNELILYIINLKPNNTALYICS